MVGGAVRDMLLGRPLHDIDIVVEGDPHEAAREIAAALAGALVPLKGLARVVAAHVQVDITRLSGPIEEDLARRDYTINAMALPLPLTSGSEKGLPPVLDPTGGRDDLRRGVVRLVSPDALAADPVRLLRGPRLALELGFRVEGRTARAIRAHAQLLGRAAPERLTEELRRLLHLPDGGRGMSLLHHLGLLVQLFPELQEAEGVAQPYPHRQDVLAHLLDAARWADVILGRSATAEEERVRRATGHLMTPQVHERLGEEVAHGWQQAALLRLGALLHDIGKPRSRRRTQDGRVHFYGHDRLGAEMAAAIAARLRLPARAATFLTALVREHMRPVGLAAAPGLPSRRALYRLHRDAGGAATALALLFVADTLATSGPGDRERLGRALEVARHLVLYGHEQDALPRLLSGHDVMAALGVGPGPLVGRVLQAVQEAAAAGEVCSKEEALDLARRIAQDPAPSQDPINAPGPGGEACPNGAQI